MYIVLGGEQIIRCVRRGIREHGAVVIFHSVGRDTVIEKVTFEQRPEGVGQAGTKPSSGWWEQ